MLYAIKGPKLFPVEHRDLEDEDKRERNALKLQAVVLEDDAVAEVRRKMLGKVTSKGNLYFSIIRNIILLFTLSKHFNNKNFKCF